MIEIRDPSKIEDPFLFFVKCRSKNNITSSIIETGKETNGGC